MGAFRHDLDNYLQATNVSLQLNSLGVRAPGLCMHAPLEELMCSTELQPQPDRAACTALKRALSYPQGGAVMQHALHEVDSMQLHFQAVCAPLGAAEQNCRAEAAPPINMRMGLGDLCSALRGCCTEWHGCAGAACSA